MTVMIKGMEMPKEGTVLVINSCGEVWSHTWPAMGYIRKDKAKAVEVPTPHGRLIDADELIAELHRLTLGENSLYERFFIDGVYAVIDTAPTVIEAEDK